VSVLAHFMVCLDFLAFPKNVLDVEPRCECSIYLFSGFYIFHTKVLPNDQRGYTYSLSSFSSGYSSSSFKSASDQLVSSQNGYVYFFFWPFYCFAYLLPHPDYSSSKHKHMTTTLQCPSPILSHQNIPSGTAPFAWTLSSSTLPPDALPSRLMSALWKELGTGHGSGGLLNAMQMGVVGEHAAKKNCSLAPYHHLFVSLVFWRVCSSVYLSLIY
jgi:hypothetical protein